VNHLSFFPRASVSGPWLLYSFIPVPVSHWYRYRVTRTLGHLAQGSVDSHRFVIGCGREPYNRIGITT
jgi:hypothetical protein